VGYNSPVVITVSAYKGGTGKTTTALHVAGVLGQQAPTLLVDRDRVPSALRWYRKRDEWPFRAVASSDATPELLREYRRTGHIVFDTPAGPDPEEIIAFGKHSDLVLIPTTPDALAIEALVDTVRDLRDEAVLFRVALVMVPPFPSQQGRRARAAFQKARLPVLEAEVPRAAAFHHAALQGRLVRDVRDRRAGALWSAYQEIANEITAAVGEKA